MDYLLWTEGNIKYMLALSYCLVKSTVTIILHFISNAGASLWVLVTLCCDTVMTSGNMWHIGLFAFISHNSKLCILIFGCFIIFISSSAVFSLHSGVIPILVLFFAYLLLSHESQERASVFQIGPPLDRPPSEEAWWALQDSESCGETSNLPHSISTQKLSSRVCLRKVRTNNWDKKPILSRSSLISYTLILSVQGMSFLAPFLTSEFPPVCLPEVMLNEGGKACLGLREWLSAPIEKHPCHSADWEVGWE